jgi:hypothetical protein
MVVADGQGVDRTLNLTSFSSIQTSQSGVQMSSSSVSTAGSVPTGAPATTIPPDIAALAGTKTPGFTASAMADASSSMPTDQNNPMATTSFSLATAPVSPLLCGVGWYAINHGRLSLPLIPSAADPTVFIWGDDAKASSLSLVNSVRISMQGTAAGVPADLSLLSEDRSDVPDRTQINGAPIGLWQVDPSGPDLASAELTIDYNSVLADALGAAPSSVQLWTYSDNTDAWTTADSFSLDSADHLVSGFGTDISYFAVSVVPAPGNDVEDVLANHLTQFSDKPSIQPSGGTQGVPEPVALPMLMLGIGLLGRRRRIS